MDKTINTGIRPTGNRIHSMDALRAIAMLLGIVLHVTIAYRLTPTAPWPYDDKVHSIFYDYTYLFLHSFRMQLFYLIAGFFARLLYLKIGDKAFIRHRFNRIVLPFLIGIVTIAPISMGTFIYVRYVSLHPAEGFGQVLHHILPYVLSWNGIVHLWFLYYLIFFYLTMGGLMLLYRRCTSLSQVVEGICKKWLIFPRWTTVILLVIPVTLALLLFNELPVEPYTGLTPRMSLLVYYGLFFFLGYAIHKYYLNRMEVFKKYTLLYLIIGIIMVPLVWNMCYRHSAGSVPAWQFVLDRMVAAFQTVVLVFGFLGFFLKYTRSERPALRYISDASYWMYLVHLPLVVAMQAWFIHSPVPAQFRFWIINAAAILVPLGSYALFVRYTFIGKMLNGPRTRRKKTAPAHKTVYTPLKTELMR